MGIEVCLERCDSYGKFGYIKKQAPAELEDDATQKC
jgi:hypothetical protein